MQGTKPIGDASQDFFKALLENYSIELSPMSEQRACRILKTLPRKTQVYIPSLPKTTFEDQLRMAQIVANAGHIAVPHIIARKTPNFQALEQQIMAYREQAGVTRVLALAGDRDTPQGKFDSSLQLIRTGVFEGQGIEHVDIAIYPEGHPKIRRAQLLSALTHKCEAIEKADLKYGLISQICFDAFALASYLIMLRELRISAPLRVGIVGVTSATSLMRYALLCGVGASFKAMREKQGLTSGLLQQVTPENFLKDLSSCVEQAGDLNIVGLHIYSLGSLTKTQMWLDTQRQR